MDLSKKRKYQVTVNFNEEERDKLWYLCMKWNQNMSSVIRDLISNTYEKYKKEEDSYER